MANDESFEEWLARMNERAEKNQAAIEELVKRIRDTIPPAPEKPAQRPS